MLFGVSVGVAEPSASPGYSATEAASGFSLVLGMAVDEDGVLWVADAAAETISTVSGGVTTVVSTEPTCPRAMVFVEEGEWESGLYLLGASSSCPDGYHLLQRLDPGSGTVQTLWETPDPGDHHWPWDIAWTADPAFGDELFLVDSAGSPDAAIALGADLTYTMIDIPENLASLSFGLGTGWEGFLYAALGDYGSEVTDGTLYRIAPSGTLSQLLPEGSLYSPGQVRFPAAGGCFPEGPYVTLSDEGRVVRVEEDGSLTEVVSGVAFGNSLGRGALAFDPAGSTLFVAQVTGEIWSVTPEVCAEGEDSDGDGFTGSEDCDDADDAINPAATEVCNDADDDCDGLVDGQDDSLVGGSTWYADADADGYGDEETEQVACSQWVGWTSRGGDCDDTRADVHPGVNEVCNGLDDDCNGLTDEVECDTAGSEPHLPGACAGCGTVGLLPSLLFALAGLAASLRARR